MKSLTIIFTIIQLMFAVSAKASACKGFYLSANQKQSKIHIEITETLFIGIPVEVKPFSANKNKNPLWLVTLENPKTKKQVKALFKPRTFGDGDGWNRVPMEYVAYEISRLLDLDIIPPVAYRYNLTINGQFFNEGSMQYFVNGARLLKDVEDKSWNVNAEDFVSNARVIDILLQNPDRHEGNFIFGPHWVDGNEKPALIDQAANMRPGTNMRLSTKGPFNQSIINHFEPKTIEKLRELSAEKLNHFLPFISKSEIAMILQNKVGILKFVDAKTKNNTN